MTYLKCVYATKVEEPYSKLLHNLHVCTSTFSLRCMMFTLRDSLWWNCNLVGLALSVYVNRGLLFSHSLNVRYGRVHYKGAGYLIPSLHNLCSCKQGRLFNCMSCCYRGSGIMYIHVCYADTMCTRRVVQRMLI